MNNHITLVSPLIIQPSPYSEQRHYNSIEPALGVYSLAAFLRVNSIPVSVLDSNLYVNKLQTPDNRFDELIDKILENSPNIIGFSTLATTYLDTLSIAKKIKKISPEVHIIFGGPHASYTADETIANYSAVDTIVRGEGEFTTLDLINELGACSPSFSNIKGLTYRCNNKSVSNPDRPACQDLSSLPIPAYDLIEINKYKVPPLILIENGRGCPYRCTFCSSATYWGHKVRTRETEDVIKHIKEIIKISPKSRIGFSNDLFWINDKYVKNLCESILDEELDIKWNSYSRINKTNPDLLELCYKSGCRQIFYGIERGCTEERKLMGKYFSDQKILDIVKSTLDAGIDVVTTFIVGIPEENKIGFGKTLQMYLSLKKMGCKSKLNIYSPLPGSKMFLSAKNLEINSHKSKLYFCYDSYTKNEKNSILNSQSMFSSYFAPTGTEVKSEEISLCSTIDYLFYIENALGVKITQDNLHNGQSEIIEDITNGDFRNALRSKTAIHEFLNEENGKNNRELFISRLKKEGLHPDDFLVKWIRGVYIKHLQTDIGSNSGYQIIP